MLNPVSGVVRNHPLEVAALKSSAGRGPKAALVCYRGDPRVGRDSVRDPMSACLHEPDQPGRSDDVR
jgi:hypothetical protein